VDPPRTTLGAPSDELLEQVQLLRRALAARREAPAGNWVEAVADDLRTGRKTGWYYPLSDGGGLAFFSERGTEAFGHVHVGEGIRTSERAVGLARALLDGLLPSIDSIDVGFTGLPARDEQDLLARLSERPGSLVIERRAMERRLSDRDDVAVPGPPDGLIQVPASDVTVEALAELDRRAFAGTVDELLIGPAFEDHRRIMVSVLAGDLGLFLAAASSALVRSEPPKLVAALISAEQMPERAVFLSFMVDPSERGRGFGSYLLRWGFRALRALGYSSVHLWVTVANEPARRLYETHDFQVVASASIYRWVRPPGEPQPHSDR
jgi:ribosomal protein S18 acetylase RimI-like enzyme